MAKDFPSKGFMADDNVCTIWKLMCFFQEKCKNIRYCRILMLYLQQNECYMMVKEKVEYIVMLIAEFAKRYKMTSQDAFRYLMRYKGFELCDSHYGIMHTLSLEDNLDSLYSYCKKNGGAL